METLALRNLYLLKLIKLFVKNQKNTKKKVIKNLLVKNQNLEKKTNKRVRF